MAAAKATAARVMKEAQSPEQQIDHAFRLAIGRAPTAKERALTAGFVSKANLEELCRALFNLNAFVYVD
jgi:hypothetical protein